MSPDHEFNEGVIFSDEEDVIDDIVPLDPNDVDGSPAAEIDDDPDFVADNGSPFNTQPDNVDARAGAGGFASFLGGITSNLTTGIAEVGSVVGAARDAGIISTTIAPATPKTPVTKSTAAAATSSNAMKLALAGAAVFAAFLLLRRK